MDRIRKYSYPLEGIALDMLGPWSIKHEISGRARRTVYAILFTCLVSRFTVVELVGGASTDDFLLAFRAFVAQHLWPRLIHLDLGSNFIGAEPLITAWSEGKLSSITDYAAKHGCQFNFNPSLSQFKTGCVEIKVRALKDSLKKACGPSPDLNVFQMNTVLKESCC